LGSRFSGAEESFLLVGDADGSGECGGDQGGLIITSVSPALGAEGHRDNEGRLPHEIPIKVGQPHPHQCRQLVVRPVLQVKDGRDKRSMIQSIGAGTQRRRLLPAFAAKGVTRHRFATGGA
jgi:hypothetical protein